MTLLRGLNPEQQAAVTLPDQHALVLAGAGSGKTRVLTTRMAWLIQAKRISPYSLLAVTFTNKSAREMLARLSTLPCDVNQGDIGSGYDLVWCSSVLHFVHNPQAVVQKMHSALNAGGRLLLAHAELWDDPQQAAQVLPFYAGVVLRGGALPRQDDITHWMQAAGFADIRALGRMAWALAPLWVHSGRRI